MKLISIAETPILKVIFDDDSIKDRIIHTEFNGKQWQDLIYFVDAEITYIKNIPKIFRIIRYYPDDTDCWDDE